jgi:hypothetical protein
MHALLARFVPEGSSFGVSGRAQGRTHAGLQLTPTVKYLARAMNAAGHEFSHISRRSNEVRLQERTPLTFLDERNWMDRIALYIRTLLKGIGRVSRGIEWKVDCQAG